MSADLAESEPSDNDWYDLAQSSKELLQGDVLAEIPIPRVLGVSFPLETDAEVEVEYEYIDGVILSQSCDLENDKIDEVLLGRVIGYDELVREHQSANPTIASTGFRQGVLDGNVNSFALLKYRDEEPAFSWTLVDFHQLVILPKKFVEEYAGSLASRIRLNSPYREYLSQAFARYMMRVALPNGTREFKGYKPQTGQ